MSQSTAFLFQAIRTMGNPSVTVRPVAADDRAEWRGLYNQYGDFYNVGMSDETAETVWGWLHDRQHPTCGLLAIDQSGKAVGLAHFRDMPSPLRGATVGFLDDLFVDPESRGSGAADALMEALESIGRERGWPLFRWITADDNYRGRAFYDRLSNKTHWNTYQYDIA